ncbi:hypothetical protein [uncultured Acetobacteroides sp.]|uniref:hypothetical protein n=1 Tax=uncultured Acetobacteroides sp. TaxID=1760811 RepID=UPI0029F46547|nr:hypothetical protein [uncultured Acetobacteroides sp.]
MKIRTSLKRNSIIFFSTSIIVLSIYSYYQKTNIEHLESRIDTLNNNFRTLVLKDSSFIDRIKLIQFKEDSYIKQLDRDTNLILWFIAIVFGLFGLISYSSFNRRVQIVEEDLQEKFNNSVGELDQLKDSLINIRADLESESSTVNSQLAEGFLKEGNSDYYLFYSLLSLNKNASCYSRISNNKQLSEATLKSITTHLVCVNSKLDTIKPKPKISEDTYLNITYSIRSINDIELIELLSTTNRLITIEKNMS